MLTKPKLKKILIAGAIGLLASGTATGIFLYNHNLRNYHQRIAVNASVEKPPHAHISRADITHLVNVYNDKYDTNLTTSTVIAREKPYRNDKSFAGESLYQVVYRRFLSDYNSHDSNPSWKPFSRTKLKEKIRAFEKAKYVNLGPEPSNDMNPANLYYEEEMEKHKHGDPAHAPEHSSDVEELVKEYNHKYGTRLTYGSVWNREVHNPKNFAGETNAQLVYRRFKTDYDTADREAYKNDPSMLRLWRKFYGTGYHKTLRKDERKYKVKMTLPKEPDYDMIPANVYYGKKIADYYANPLVRSRRLWNKKFPPKDAGRRLIRLNRYKQIANQLAITNKQDKKWYRHAYVKSDLPHGVKVNEYFRAHKISKGHSKPTDGGPYRYHYHHTRAEAASAAVSLGWYHQWLNEYKQEDGAGPGNKQRSNIQIKLPPYDPPEKPIRIFFPNQAQYNGKDVTAEVIINHIKYYNPWYPASHIKDSRNIEVSKNMYDGMKYNGIINMQVHYRFLYPKGSKKGQEVPLDNCWMEFRQIDGLDHYEGDGKDVKPKDFNIGKGYGGHVLASHNNELMTKTLWHHRPNFSDPTGSNVQYADGNELNRGEYDLPESQVRTYPSKILPQHYATAGPYGTTSGSESHIATLFALNGGTHPEPFSKDTPQDIVKESQGNETVPPNFFAGSGTGYGNVRPFTDITPKKYITCQKTTSKSSNKETLYLGDPKPSNKLNSRSLLAIKKAKSAQGLENMGIAPSQATYIAKNGLDKWIKYKSDCQNTALLTCTPPKQQTNDPSQATYTLGDKRYYYTKINSKATSVKSLEKFGVIPSQAKAIMKHGFRTWAINQPCVNPKTKLHKSIGKGIKHATIDGTQGGILKYPKQVYNYNIEGTTPKYKDNHAGSTGCGASGPSNGSSNNTTQWNATSCTASFGTKYAHASTDYERYTKNTNDHYNVIDNLPSDVTLEKAKITGLKEGTMTVKRSRSTNGIDFIMNPHYFEMHLKRNGHRGSLVENGGNGTNPSHYKIVLTVKADHLPKAKSSGWERFFNGYKYNSKGKNTPDGNGTYSQQEINGNTGKKHRSNITTVEIKKIEAQLWHYDYNHKNNLRGSTSDMNFFPDKYQPFGITNGYTNANDSSIPKDVNSNKTTPDANPNSTSDYKPYRFKGYFNKHMVKEAKKTKHSVISNGYTDKQDSLLKHTIHYGYVGTTFGVKTIGNKGDPTADKDGHNGKKGNKETWRYHFVYPAFKRGDAKIKEYWTFPSMEQTLKAAVDTPGNDITKDADKKGSNTVDTGTPRDGIDSYDGNHDVPVNVNPDKGDAYSDPDGTSHKNFVQNNYFPYIVPRLRIFPKKGNNGPYNHGYGAGRLVIDTNKCKQGLPFRLDMRVQNFLWGRKSHGQDVNGYNNLFYNEFKNDKMTTNIYQTNGGKKNRLYQATRPFLSNGRNKNKALVSHANHNHSVTNDEWPKGSKDWKGYKEYQALYHKYSKNYDLGNIDCLASGKNHGRVDITTRFKVHDPTGAQITYHKVNTHGYVSRKNRLTGHNDKGEDRGFDSYNKHRFVEPERTIAYANGKVRTLYEELDATQPRNGIAKTGFGMTGNDFGLYYMGHLAAYRYSHRGTSLNYAFPGGKKNSALHPGFNTSESDISYGSDPRNHRTSDWITSKNPKVEPKMILNNAGPKMRADPLLHVRPKWTRVGVSHRQYKGKDITRDDDEIEEDRVLPDYLDKLNGNKEYATQADEHFDNIYNEHLSAGAFSSTYGFYPRIVYHNDNGIDTQPAGQVAIAKGLNGKLHSAFEDTGINSQDYQNKSYNVATKSVENLTTNTNTSYPDTPFESIKKDDQNERMFTPKFMKLGKYPVFFERAYDNVGKGSRYHRLGGNYFDIDEDRPVLFYAHEYISKNSPSKSQDEFSLQPVLTNSEHGISQAPASSPRFYKAWIQDAKNLVDNHSWVGTSFNR